MSDQIILEPPSEQHVFEWGDIVTVTMKDGRVSKGDVRGVKRGIALVYVWESWRSSFKGDENKTEADWAKEYRKGWMGSTELIPVEELGFLRKGIEDGFGAVF